MPINHHRTEEVDFDSRLRALEDELLEIRNRNQRVEANKSWETSRTRLLSVTVVTYVTMTLLLSVLGTPRPLLNALVPTAGFFLSTLSLPVVRRIWEQGLTKTVTKAGASGK